jgi:N-acetylneuraminic acid mutarotase
MPANDVTAIAVSCATGAYTLGGTITGLSAGGLILANGTDRLTVAANAAQFTMPTPVVAMSSYALTIARQPSGLTCTASAAAGTMPPGNYLGIALLCAAREWTWVSGPNGNNVTGVYGTRGTPAASNDPGSRQSAVSWVDLSGNLWLYGGYTYVGPSDARILDDLWEYSQSLGQWTWMGGAANTDNVTPVYGTEGTPGSANEPGSRINSTVWTDAAGNFWLFGGNDSTGYDDLWKYSPTSHLWTWMSGSTSGNAPGVYGVEGTPAPGNRPGARAQAVSWVDAAGNLWLFGGVSFSGSGNLNDLWQYSPASGLWTWINGPNTLNATGVYGMQGTPNALNMPGARTNGVTWADGAGNLWLFGGQGYASTGGLGDLNDLWKYDTASGQWTWMGGSNTINATGAYGTQGTAAAGNVPPARNGALSWTDGSGTLWLFGGQMGTSGNQELNDLWQYSPNSNQWTWVRGANTINTVSVYGTQGTPAPGNMPGASTYMVAWADPTGTFWLFGGNEFNALLNTLWSY